MNPDSFVSPELIELFNNAAELSRNTKYAEAVEAFDAILKTQQPDGKPYIISGRFAGIVNLRKSWALMDLEKYTEAKEVLEDEQMEAFLFQFEPKDLYDYYFSYANILGSLKEIKPMEKAFEKAMGFADELGDDQLKLQIIKSLEYYKEK